MSTSQSISHSNDSFEEHNSEEEHMLEEDGGGAATGVESSIPNLGTQANASEATGVTGTSKRKRKAPMSRSAVWYDFTKDKTHETATYNHCGIVYKNNSSKNGTSTLKQHLTRCPRVPRPSGEQTELSLQSNQARKGDLSTWRYDPKVAQDELTCMIVECELPFKFVEQPRFRSFVHALNPRFNVPSRPTARKNVVDLYEDTKKNMMQVFQNNGSKVSLTTDAWTSEQRQNYMVITAHFIDREWKLQKKIINFTTIKSHRVDNASANDNLVNYLKRRFASLMLSDYVHVRCVAHIINLIVMEGIKESIASIDRVRAVIKFMRASPARIQKFKECAEMERIPSKASLCLDVCTRWNSTYLMLDTAMKFETAFERFEELEPQITSEVAVEGGMPKQEDWWNVKRLVTFLQYFYQLTLKVSGTSYVTSNQFFHDLSVLFYVLKEMKSSDDPQMSSMADKMIGKSKKYWGGRSNKLNILLIVVVVFDPRYKLQYVTLALKEMYTEQIAIEVAEKVKSTTLKLFNEYQNEQSLQNPSRFESSSVASIRDEEQTTENRARAIFKKLQTVVGGGESQTELDKYLGEGNEIVKDGEDFDVLTWWKINFVRFPVLSAIARDLLAIPISALASESAFSTGGRVLDTFRSSLTPKIVESLICVDDWLGGLPLLQTLMVVEDLGEQEAFEQELAKSKNRVGSSRATQPPMFIDNPGYTSWKLRIHTYALYRHYYNLAKLLSIILGIPEFYVVFYTLTPRRCLELVFNGVGLWVMATFYRWKIEHASIVSAFCSFADAYLSHGLKFKSDQSQEAKKMEKLNNIFFALMARGPDVDISEVTGKEQAEVQQAKTGKGRKQ
ncbi:zinc finger BED domain-containing protein RICESLEEPER 2-like [Tripterygium wilfordii]|uniref:zinc finger BED domain-containing protein RICESLEEPER 2-like n=1 Tax=Tripterygium wilfordii TaxID=458696 RepID=UPI0018F850B5|nr:zinc finger BED domain-containing protein RICESLEEPER 2-like [Tripterygium wilfordii]